MKHATEMEVILHKPNGGSLLKESYIRAFGKAVELYVLTAFLTEWDDTLVLNKGCTKLRIIIGKDFGITRKAACTKALSWLRSDLKHRLLVADDIDGFHPKAVFWKEANGKHHAIVGSSNLTRAAFTKNFEANVCSKISDQVFLDAKRWVREIESKSEVVTPGWIEQYKEAPKSKPKKPTGNAAPNLPDPTNIKQLISDRKKALKNYQVRRAGLISLFKRCAAGAITSQQFYEQLPDHWSYEKKDRLQGLGWARLGKGSNFKLFAKSYLRMLQASTDDRDEIIAEEIDFLKTNGSSLRVAFLSEMLCLEFPEQYPVLNYPVKQWLKAIGYRSTRGASEGSKYVGLAEFMRKTIARAKKYPAKNIAELDAVIWQVYGR
jgi:HKD family nuclease